MGEGILECVELVVMRCNWFDVMANIGGERIWKRQCSGVLKHPNLPRRGKRKGRFNNEDAKKAKGKRIKTFDVTTNHANGTNEIQVP